MIDYFYVFISVVLLAVCFVLQNVYQRCTGGDAVSQNGTDELKIAVRKPFSLRATATATRHKTLSVKIAETEKEEIKLSLAALDPYETATVFFD